jgi:hypothetical protein
MFAQLRYEYNPIDPSISKLFGPRIDSQDAWILHTNYTVAKKHEKLFDFNLGILGCDNKIMYLFALLGYEIICHPAFIRTLHYHLSQKRNYTAKDRIYPTYGMIVPYGFTMEECKKCYGQVPYLEYYSCAEEMPQLNDNSVLYEYILSSFEKNKPFVIPRISNVETHAGWIGHQLINNNVTNEDIEYVKYIRPRLKCTAGILIKNPYQLMEFAQSYMKSFENCELYGGWDREGPMYDKYHANIDSFCKNKKRIWAEAFSAYNYIYTTPWTHALRGKRILVISPFVESIRKQLPIREKLYDGVDLFPECTFVLVNPPQTLGYDNTTDNTEDYFGVHLQKLKEDVDDVKDLYDIALVSCGGYSAPICNYIYESGRSAIQVSGVLQMLFGIIGNRWMSDSPEIVKLFFNQHWTRPTSSETPKCHKSVENSCYW